MYGSKLNTHIKKKYSYGRLQHFKQNHITRYFIQGADKSLVRPTSRCILFDGENI
jgi:hypothetical protein